MKNAFALTVLLLASSFASAVGEIECVGAKVAITLAPSSKGENGVEAILTVSRDEKATTLRYDRDIDFIGVECRKNHRPVVREHRELDPDGESFQSHGHLPAS